MTYALGIDVGTTQTAAAVHRDGMASIVTLGTRSATIASAVHISADGTVLVGDAALRRGAVDPTRLAREFKRRIGDPEPLLLGGIPWSPSAITARLLHAVIALVTDREGSAPSQIALTHPANWGPYKTDLLREAAGLAGLPDVVLLSEPEAAAVHHASQARVPIGSTIAVYDLGGGTFDAAVLRSGPDGFQLRGRPGGLERFGGIDLDAAVLGHVRRALGEVLTELDPNDPASLAAMTRLRDECAAAREALSADVEVAIPVVLPNVMTEVRLTRAELEAMVAPALADTVSTMRQALRSAGVQPVDLDALLLVGGASRMPLVARLLTDELAIPVATDTHPKHVVALGAARVAADGRATPMAWAAPVAASPSGSLATPSDAPPVLPSAGAPVGSSTADGNVAARVARSSSRPTRRRSRQGDVVGSVVIALLCLTGLATWWFLRSDDDSVASMDPRSVRPSITSSSVTTGAAATAVPIATTATTGAGGTPQGNPPAVTGSGPVRLAIERDEVGSLRVRWSIDEALLPAGSPSALQVHLFYDSQHPESAGANAPEYGRDPGIYYFVTDPTQVELVPSNLGTDDNDATALCALVADDQFKTLDPAAVTCVALPAP